MSKKIMKLSDLKPDDKNVRSHGEENKRFIAKSIGEFGLNRPIVVDENGKILSGNGVVEVAASLGVEDIELVEADGNEIVAVQVDHLDDDAKRLYSIADNRAGELSEWDTDKLAERIRSGVDVSPMFFDDELDNMMGTSWWSDDMQEVVSRGEEAQTKQRRDREINQMTYMCPHCYHEWTERKV